MGPDQRETQPGYDLTGQVVAAYIQVRLTPQDFGRPRKRDFAGLNLLLGIFDQPKKNEFFNRLVKVDPSTVPNCSPYSNENGMLPSISSGH